MPYIILFEDNANADPDIRKSHMPQHLSFLEANADAITAAGPLAASDGTGAGGIWIVNASTEQEVDQLVHADPFWPTGLRKSFRILKWTQVYADGKRLIQPG